MPLHVAAPEQLHQFKLVMGLHTFGRGVHLQHFGKAGDRGDDRAVAAALFGCPAHKAAVDLDTVEGGLAQIAQGGIADAEIVEREADSQLFQRAEGGLGARRVA